MLRVGLVAGTLICEPQVRLGRRRHDGRCDDCGGYPDRYYEERLAFPDREYTSTIDHMRKLTEAEYERLCLDCSVDREQEDSL